MHRTYLTLLFLATAISLIYAQGKSPYFVRHYNTEDGLSNNWVSDIAQDADGFIWCASQYGLNRFDGQHFTAYTYRPGDRSGIGANWVKALLPSRGGQLFLGTYGKGLNLMDTEKESFSSPLDSFVLAKEFVAVNDLKKDGDGNIWLATNNGAFRFDPDKKNIKKIFGTYARSVAHWKNGTYLLTSPKGLFATDGDSTYYFPLFKNQNTMGAFALSPDSLLVFADAYLYVAHKSNGQWQKERLLSRPVHHSSNHYWPFIFRDKQG